MLRSSTLLGVGGTESSPRPALSKAHASQLAADKREKTCDVSRSGAALTCFAQATAYAICSNSRADGGSSERGGRGTESGRHAPLLELRGPASSRPHCGRRRPRRAPREGEPPAHPGAGPSRPPTAPTASRRPGSATGPAGARGRPWRSTGGSLGLLKSSASVRPARWIGRSSSSTDWPTITPPETKRP